MDVVGSELEIPAHLSGVGLHGHDRRGVQVVSQPNVAVPVGGGIPRAPVDEVQFRIVGTGDPGRRSTLFPRVAGPGLVPRFSGTGNGVETPGPLAGGGVVGIQESPDAVFPARDAHDDLVLHGQRRHRDAVALVVLGHLRLPDDGARLGVQGHELGVQRSQVDPAVQNGHSPVHLAAADADAFRQFVPVLPVGPAGPDVQRQGVAGRLRHVHDVVDHQRRGLHLLQALELERPVQAEAVDIGGVDLVQAAVAPTPVTAGIGEPVPRQLVRRQQFFGRHLSREDRRFLSGNRSARLAGRRQQQHQPDRRMPFHGRYFLFSEAR